MDDIKVHSLPWEVQEYIQNLKRKAYTIEDVVKCVENWGMCKVEKKYIEAFLNKDDENPIQDNRVVKDYTFALRLLSFAMDTQCGDACGEDEKVSMISYATQLLKYQIDTVTDKNEVEYLVRCDARLKLKEGLKFLK